MLFRKIHLKPLIWIFIALLLSIESNAAGVFRIVNRSYGNISGNSTLVAQIDQLFNTMETGVNNQLSQFDAGSYLNGTANATALASSGGTHDIAQRFKYIYLEVGGGLSADLGGIGPLKLMQNSSSVTEVKGLSGAMNLTLGTTANVLRIPKFSVVDPERLKIYLGLAQFSRSVDSVNFEYMSYSLMGQYRFFDQRSYLYGTFKWNGLDFTTGFKYNNIKILYSKNFSETVQQTITDPSIGGSQSMTMTYTTNAQLGAKSSVTTIPMEVTSSVGVLYLFDFIFGLGTDFNFGSTTSIISSPGSVTAQESSGLAGTMSGDIEFDLGQKSSPQSMSSRYLLGVALDFRAVSFLLQYNKNITNHAESIHFGVGAHF